MLVIVEAPQVDPRLSDSWRELLLVFIASFAHVSGNRQGHESSIWTATGSMAQSPCTDPCSSLISVLILDTALMPL